MWSGHNRSDSTLNRGNKRNQVKCALILLNSCYFPLCHFCLYLCYYLGQKLTWLSTSKNTLSHSTCASTNSAQTEKCTCLAYDRWWTQPSTTTKSPVSPTDRQAQARLSPCWATMNKIHKDCTCWPHTIFSTF